MRAILELSNGTEEFPTCFEDLQKGDCVRDPNLRQIGGFVTGISGDRVLCEYGPHQYILYRTSMDVYGLIGDLPEWIKA